LKLAVGCNDFLAKPVSLEWSNKKIIEWGSIKALQMFVDSPPDFVKTVSAGQTVQAQNIVPRLYVPIGKVFSSPCRSVAASGVWSGLHSRTLSIRFE
jgi:osomolarity two-component system, response regulator SSK1